MSGQLAMRTGHELSASPVTRQPRSNGLSKTDGLGPAMPETTLGSDGSAPVAPGAPALSKSALPLDPWRVLLAWKRFWSLAAAASLLLAAPAALVGILKFETTYTATVQIIRRELPNSFRASEVGEAFKPRQFSAATIVAMMRTPTLVRKAAELAKPPMTSRALLQALTITPEKNTDLISVSLLGRRNARATAELLNLYAREVINLTQSLQQQEAAELDQFLRKQLGQADSELSSVNQELVQFTRDARFFGAETELQAYLRELAEAEVRLQTAQLEQQSIEERLAAIEREMARQGPAAMKLTSAREQLKSLLVSYTESNPLVQAQQAKVEALETESAAASNQVTELPLDASSVVNSLFLDRLNYQAQRQAVRHQLSALAEARDQVRAKLEGVPEKSMRFARLKAKQQSLESMRALLAGRQREAKLFAENSPGYYRLLAPTTPEQVEHSSKRRKLILITLGAAVAGFLFGLVAVTVRELLDERLVSGADLRRVAQAPVVATLGELADESPEALATWRFRTWSSLAKNLGFRPAESVVLGITSTEPGEGRSTWLRLLADAASDRGLRAVMVTNDPDEKGALDLSRALDDPSLLDRMLELRSPGWLQLACPRQWEWTLERRTAWEAALKHWLQLPKIALLVELPPAGSIAAVLLAATVPRVLWLASSGAASQSKMAELIKTARSGEVHVVGTLMNRLPNVFKRLPDLSRFGLAVLLGLGLCHGVAHAQEASAAPAGYFSATAAGPKLAPWQEKFTLGAGDVLNFSVYGRKDLTRNEIPIGPDGKVSYLQAQGVQAAGLTIDELREKMNEALEGQYRHASVMIWPASYRSKKFYLLGAVTDRGVYLLDRPLTVIEAVARARGIATGLLEQSTIEIADLPRAFLIRQGQRMPVDFQKLFQEGDLSQNILLEPEDYLYFPSAVVNEVYVLGAVTNPGTVGVTARATVLSAITKRGGFMPKAYQQKVLLVRGGLNKPETEVVDVARILRGQLADHPVQPKDIIYVADRPWARAEDLLDMALRAFIQTAVTVWASGNVPAAIQTPIVPTLP